MDTIKCFLLKEDFFLQITTVEEGRWYHNTSLETYSARAGTLFSEHAAVYYRENGALFRQVEVPYKTYIEDRGCEGALTLLDIPEWDGPTRGFEGKPVRLATAQDLAIFSSRPYPWSPIKAKDLNPAGQ